MNSRFRLPFILTVLLLLTGLFLVPAHSWNGKAERQGEITAIPPASFAPSHPYVPGRVLVKLRGEQTALDTLLSDNTLPGTHIEPIGVIRPLGVHILKVPQGREEDIAYRLQKHPLVRYAEPDYIYHTLTTRPNDTYYSQYQWQLPHIGAETAWDTTTGDSSIIIAVLDTGVDLGHPDLASKLVSGYDFINNDDNPDDDEGHGTHVAGIAAAASNNNTGIAGVSWGARIMPVKVLNEEGSGPNSDIAQGVIWAVDHGADILNMSLGGESESATLRDAVTYAYEHGALVVAAAGNSYQEGNRTNYPAAYEHVLAVAATNDRDEHARYSNSGDYVDVAAPGGDPDGNSDDDPRHWILSTFYRSSGNNYAWMSGTSQAAPHVAGLAALLLTLDPTLSPDDLTDIIEDTAVDVESPGWDEFSGYGRIDMAAAVAAVLATPTPTPTAPPIPSATPTPTFTPTNTPGTTPTVPWTPTSTPTPTPTVTPTPGSSPTATPTSGATPTSTPTPTPTSTPVGTAPPTPTPSPVPYPMVDERVNRSTAGVQDMPGVGVTAAGRVIVVWRDMHTTPGHILASVRDAGSDAWDRERRLGNISDGGTEPTRLALAVNAQGRGAVVWHDVHTNDHDVYIVTGNVARGHWDPPQEVGAEGMFPFHQGTPAVAVAEDGTIYVAWVDNRRGTFDIFWTYRRPGEAAWHPPTPVRGASGPGVQTQPTLAVSGSNVYFAWVDGVRGAIQVTRYDTTNGRWTPLPDVGGGFPAQARPASPVLAVEHGRVHLLWQDSRDARHGVDIYHSVWEHGTWSPAARIHRDNQAAVQLLPAVATTPDGIVAVWTDRRSGTSRVYMAWWQANRGWVGERPVAHLFTAPQTDPAVATDEEGNAFVVWTDARDTSTGTDIYFRYVPLRDRYRLFVPWATAAFVVR